MFKVLKCLKDEIRGSKDEDGSSFLKKLQTPHPLPFLFSPPLWTLPLPPEILYIIIDGFTPIIDLHTLKSLCLTCRCLRVYASQRIFSDISIGGSDYIDSELKKTEPPIVTQAERLARIIHRSPHLIASTHTLRIFHARGHNSPYPMNREEASLIYILSRELENLTSLHLICQLHWAYLLWSVKDALLDASRRPTLREVKLANVTVPVALLELWKFQRLDLTHVLFQPERGGTNLLEQFEELCIRDEDGFSYLFLTFPAELSRLRTLEYKGPERYVTSLRDVIKRCPLLERLHVHRDEDSSFMNSLDLGHATALKHLLLSSTVRHSYLPRLRFSKIGSNWMSDALQTCAVDNSIEKITIVIRMDHPQRFDLWDWTSINNLFSPPCLWKSLKMVEVIACGEEEMGFDFFHGVLNSLVHDGIPSLAGRVVVNWYQS